MNLCANLDLVLYNYNWANSYTFIGLHEYDVNLHDCALDTSWTGVPLPV